MNKLERILRANHRSECQFCTFFSHCREVVRDGTPLPCFEDSDLYPLYKEQEKDMQYRFKSGQGIVWQIEP